MKKVVSMALASMICLSLSTSVYAFEVEKVDLMKELGPSEWAQSEIENARNNELVLDELENQYKGNITRAEFAKTVVNMLEKALGKELTVEVENPFSDTSDNTILKAYSNGIVSGTSDTTFSPNDNITREQIATMFYRAIKKVNELKGSEIIVINTNDKAWTDNNEISSWAKEGVNALVNAEIMSGTSQVTVSPKATTTVEQAILLTNRLFAKIK